MKIAGVSTGGEILDLVLTINGMIDQLARFAAEVGKVAHAVGMEGKLGVQAEVENAQGTWQEITYVFLMFFFPLHTQFCIIVLFLKILLRSF